MDRPVIGVTALVDDERESCWMLPGYMEGIAEAGGIPVMLPLTEDEGTIKQLVEMFDGFLFTGGHDVSPELYGAERLDVCGRTSRIRDMMELRLLKLAYGADKPVLGICRGIQFINAAMGGSLWQDLPTQRPGRINHHQSPPYDVPVHSVTVTEGSPLYGLLEDLLEEVPYNQGTEGAGGSTGSGSCKCGDSGARINYTDNIPGGGLLKVNSYHHQAVKELAPGLSIMAVSEDGLTEGICDSSRRFLWAVQWHPEFSHKTDESSRRIFRAFVESAKL